MKTEIENIIYNYANELKIGGQSESQISHILIRVINAITLSDKEKEKKPCKSNLPGSYFL